MAEEQSLRELIDSKFTDDAEPPSAAPTGEGSNEPPATGALEGGEPPATTAPAEVATSTPTPPPPQEGEKAQPQADGRPPIAQASTGPKPPQSWRPEVREHWTKLPPEVQQEVIRREQQVSRALSDASKYVSHYNQFQELCAPYSSLIAMEGGNPLVSFKDYLQTSAMLRLGGVQEKANAVAGAIVKFGVDVHQLDEALAAHYKGQPPQVTAPQQPLRDPRLDELLGNMQARQQQRDQELTQAQLSEIDEFSSNPTNEFFNDVRPMIADILEVYANQGIKCTLKDAYDKACLLHPRISKVIQTRATATAANSLVKQNQAAMAAKRAAASSPPGAPNISPIDGNNLSLRDTIGAAMNAVESRV